MNAAVTRILRLVLLGVAATLSAAASAAQATPAATAHIGIIGTGHIGSALAEHWAGTGHELVISGLDAEALKPLAARLGAKVRVGTPREAAAFGDVVLIAVPYKALPQIGQDYRAELAGKVVIDTGNPYPQRDGDMADEARRLGTGITSARYLPGVRLVRAFNAIAAANVKGMSNRAGSRLAIPIAADDAAALRVAAELVDEAGFDAVVVGGLSEAKRFDVDTPVYVKVMNASELRTALGLE